METPIYNPNQVSPNEVSNEQNAIFATALTGGDLSDRVLNPDAANTILTQGQNDLLQGINQTLDAAFQESDFVQGFSQLYDSVRADSQPFLDAVAPVLQDMSTMLQNANWEQLQYIFITLGGAAAAKIDDYNKRYKGGKITVEEAKESEKGSFIAGAVFMAINAGVMGFKAWKGAELPEVFDPVALGILSYTLGGITFALERRSNRLKSMGERNLEQQNLDANLGLK